MIENMTKSRSRFLLIFTKFHRNFGRQKFARCAIKIEMHWKFQIAWENARTKNILPATTKKKLGKIGFPNSTKYVILGNLARVF